MGDTDTFAQSAQPQSQAAVVDESPASTAVGTAAVLGRVDSRALGAVLILKITGYMFTETGSFTVLFIIAGSACLISIAAIHLLVPKLEPARIRT